MIAEFTGKERDQETGLDYFETRYFSAAQGRFTSPDGPFNDHDESNPQSWNLFSYVRNNPLRYVDPTGMCSEDGKGGYTDEGSGLFSGKCSEGQIGGTKPQEVTVGVGRDEANLIMLQILGDRLGSSHQWATVASGGYQGAAAVQSGRSLIGGLWALKNLPTVRWNYLKGAVAGGNIVRILLWAKGYQMLGRRVTAYTSQGKRVIDWLVKSPTGEVVAIEVKTGNAVRTSSQFAKDIAMEVQGARLAGANAGSLSGQTLKIRTEVWNPF